MADTFDDIMRRGTVITSIRRLDNETGETLSVRTDKPVETFNGRGIAEACRVLCNAGRTKLEREARLAQRRADISGDDGFNAAMAVLGFAPGEGAELTPEEQGEGENAGAGRQERQVPATNTGPGGRR